MIQPRVVRALGFFISLLKHFLDLETSFLLFFSCEKPLDFISMEAAASLDYLCLLMMASLQHFSLPLCLRNSQTVRFYPGVRK